MQKTCPVISIYILLYKYKLYDQQTRFRNRRSKRVENLDINCTIGKL